MAEPEPASEESASDLELAAPLSEQQDEGPPSYWFFAVVAVLAAALDLGTKEWAREALHGADQGIRPWA